MNAKWVPFIGTFIEPLLSLKSLSKEDSTFPSYILVVDHPLVTSILKENKGGA